MDRRDMLKKAGAAGVVAWVAPVVTTMHTPASAQSVRPRPPIVVSGTATKSLGCFGNDEFLPSLGVDGWWHFYFQGCGLSESVALADPPGGPFADAYQPPTGYQCRMQLIAGTTLVYDTGYVTNPINGIADTGGVVFIGTGAYPDGHGDMNWQIVCDPL